MANKTSNMANKTSPGGLAGPCGKSQHRHAMFPGIAVLSSYGAKPPGRRDRPQVAAPWRVSAGSVAEFRDEGERHDRRRFGGLRDGGGTGSCVQGAAVRGQGDPLDDGAAAMPARSALA